MPKLTNRNRQQKLQRQPPAILLNVKEADRRAATQLFPHNVTMDLFEHEYVIPLALNILQKQESLKKNRTNISIFSDFYVEYLCLV